MRYQHSSFRPRWYGVAVHVLVAGAIASSIGAATAAAALLREGVPAGDTDAEGLVVESSEALPYSPCATRPTTKAAAIVMRRDTGEVLGAGNPARRRAPAGTTKTTALLAWRPG